MKNSLELVYSVRLRIDFEGDVWTGFFSREIFWRMTSGFPLMVLDSDCGLEAVTHAYIDAFTLWSRVFLLAIGGLSFLMCVRALNN